MSRRRSRDLQVSACAARGHPSARLWVHVGLQKLALGVSGAPEAVVSVCVIIVGCGEDPAGSSAINTSKGQWLFVPVNPSGGQAGSLRLGRCLVKISHLPAGHLTSLRLREVGGLLTVTGGTPERADPREARRKALGTPPEDRGVGLQHSAPTSPTRDPF